MRIARFAAAVLVALALTGCPSLMSTLVDVIAKVQDGVAILDQIQAFVRRWFAAHPDPARQAIIEQAIGRSRTALHAALRAAHGAQEVDQGNADAALADFRAAYSDLLSLLHASGLMSAPGTLGVAGGEQLRLPEPLALVRADRQVRP